MQLNGAPADNDELLVVVMLTDRERDVLSLLARGNSAKQVGFKLGITPRTVEAHIERSRLKTRTRNTTHMVADAMRRGLISLA